MKVKSDSPQGLVLHEDEDLCELDQNACHIVFFEDCDSATVLIDGEADLDVLESLVSQDL